MMVGPAKTPSSRNVISDVDKHAESKVNRWMRDKYHLCSLWNSRLVLYAYLVHSKMRSHQSSDMAHVSNVIQQLYDDVFIEDIQASMSTSRQKVVDDTTLQYLVMTSILRYYILIEPYVDDIMRTT